MYCIANQVLIAKQIVLVGVVTSRPGQDGGSSSVCCSVCGSVHCSAVPIRDMDGLPVHLTPQILTHTHSQGCIVSHMTFSFTMKLFYNCSFYFGHVPAIRRRAASNEDFFFHDLLLEW